MSTDKNHSSVHRCTCRETSRRPRLLLDRRRFLAVGSGCVLGALGGVAADKLPPVDIGALTKFSEDGISEEFTKNDFFVIRYQGRLFAASTTCPHMGSLLQRDSQDATRIKCTTHGSVFDGEGLATVGPASSGLVRHGISVNKDGHVMVDPSKEFHQDKWGDKGCYVEVK
ncbi:MAG: Rieske 2Fe-2S domain-containing protein [Verrucomicrobia bacterium]|nr:Rieske 2Fe-2S domain-containing protein [Verrucomicrobiota bacterium]